MKLVTDVYSIQATIQTFSSLQIAASWNWKVNTEDIGKSCCFRQLRLTFLQLKKHARGTLSMRLKLLHHFWKIIIMMKNVNWKKKRKIKYFLLALG